MDTKSIVDHVSTLDKAGQQEVYRGILSKMQPDVASAELGTYLAAKSPRVRATAVAQFNETASGGPGLDRPSRQAGDMLWLVVVTAFAVILIGAFLTLAAGVFITPAQNGVKPELILTTFTSAVGFLAGLFVPSPAMRNDGTDRG
jgi:hypothetical protein